MRARGKIVASGGCDILSKNDEPILRQIINLSEKSAPSVLFLPTASFDKEDDAPLYRERFLSLGCSSFEMLCLTDTSFENKYTESRILNADIIYAGGGNLKFLMDTWKCTGADVYLKKAYVNGAVLSGSSSGAMCWFDFGYDDCGENGSFMLVKCLGLIPYCNCPHFESENWKSFEMFVKENSIEAVAIDNDTAIVYCDGEYDVIKTDTKKSAYKFTAENNYEKTDMTI